MDTAEVEVNQVHSCFINGASVALSRATGSSRSIDRVPSDRTLLPSVQRIKRSHVFVDNLEVEDLRIRQHPLALRRLWERHESSDASQRTAPSAFRWVDSPMLERPPDGNLSRILLVPLGEAEEHRVVKSALHERRVGLDNDTR